MIHKIKEFFDGLQTKENWFRFGTVFTTSGKCYFYDTGTGKIFSINENVYLVLDCILRTNNFDNLKKIGLSADALEDVLEQIKETVAAEHILQAVPVTEANIATASKEFLRENLKSIDSVTLEVTERCNLRCSYCIYGDEHADFRDFGTKDMNIETAKKAADFLFHYGCNDVYYGFYGGEPLLRFDLMKEAIEYTLSKKPADTQLYFSMTSNMTLMTEEIAEFIGSIENFIVLASVDGPAEIHDKNRVFANGQGSFDATMRGVKLLVDARKRHNIDRPMMFSAVLSPPYTKEKFNSIQKFIYEADWMPENSLVQTGYINYGPKSQMYISINERPENQLSYDGSLRGFDPLQDWAVYTSDYPDYGETFATAYLDKPFKKLHERRISEKPMPMYPMGGCCMPGARKAFVLTTGEILPCERVGTISPIGNINTGYDVDLIHKVYYEDFNRQAAIYCGECWAINLCSSCYSGCMNADGTVDFSYRHKQCAGTREQIRFDLVCYHEVLERSPEIILRLNQMEMV